MSFHSLRSKDVHTAVSISDDGGDGAQFAQVLSYPIQPISTLNQTRKARNGVVYFTGMDVCTQRNGGCLGVVGVLEMVCGR
jgi:hypothetical protein